MMQWYKLAALVSTFTAISSFQVFAENETVIGQLTCTTRSTTDVSFYVEQDFDCSFTSSDGTVDSYQGMIRKLGLNVSAERDEALSWTVFAPAVLSDPPHFLRGSYKQDSADRSILVGGISGTYSLQTLGVFSGLATAPPDSVEEFELR